MDLSQSSLVEDFAKDVLRKHEEVHVLVNNAGMGTPPTGPLEGRARASSLHFDLFLGNTATEVYTLGCLGLPRGRE